MYRASRKATGKKRCAIGLLIPNKKYTTELEDQCCESIIDAVDIPEGMYLIDLENIQACHDGLVSFGYDAKWNPSAFIARINQLDCFNDVVKVTE